MTESQIKLVAWFRNHAAAQQAKGHFGRAIDVLEGAQDLVRRNTKEENLAQSPLIDLLLDEGACYLEAGKATQALPLLEECFELAEGPESGIDEIQSAEIRQRLGTALDLLGREEAAGEHFLVALEILQSVDDPPRDTIAHLANNLGMIERNRGQFDAAASYYQRAQSIFESLGNDHALDLATVCNNQGSLCCAAERPELARDFHLAALKLRRDHLPENHPDIGQSACNLAVVYHQIGDHEKASRHYDRALEIMKNAAGEDPEIYEITSSNYVTLLRETGQDAKAEKLEKATAKQLKKIAS